MECLSPPMEFYPEDDWNCPWCTWQSGTALTKNYNTALKTSLKRASLHGPGSRTGLFIRLNEDRIIGADTFRLSS